MPIHSVPLRCLPDCSVICPFRVFRLFPSISLFQLVSFQFSILGSGCSESGSLLSIRLHFCSATTPFPLISVSYCLWSYDLRFPLQIMIRFLLFCSVYKSGKLCSYSLACNRTKPPVTWPSTYPNTQSLSVSVLASQPCSQSPRYPVNPCPVRKSKDPHILRGEGTAHKLRPSLSPLRYTSRISPFPHFVPDFRPFSVFRFLQRIS